MEIIASEFQSGRVVDAQGNGAFILADNDPNSKYSGFGFTAGFNITYDGKFYKEWGRLYFDSNSNGIYEGTHVYTDEASGIINSTIGFGGEGIDEHYGFWYSEEYTVDRGNDVEIATWNRSIDSWVGDWEGLDGLGRFEYIKEIIFDTSKRDDEFVGSTNDDLIYGKKGNDIFAGRLGNDRLFGESGKDILYGDAGNDFLSGGSSSDILYGGAGDDLLKGESGSDKMYGGDGDDTYYVSIKTDSVIEEANEGTDLIYSSVTFTASSNVENLTLTGKRNISGSGNSLDNTLTGNNKANKLYGKSGDDKLYGGRGKDRLYGEEGDDFLDGGTSKDKVYGGNGNDELHGGTGKDFLRGGEDEDTLYGDGGNDKLMGEGGEDILYGGNGKDFLRGGEDEDTLYGESGNDKIMGGDGNDILVGGLGKDNLYGGSGNDVFKLTEGIGYDRIRDFKKGEDRVDIAEYDINELGVFDSGKNIKVYLDENQSDLLAIIYKNNIDDGSISEFIF